MLGLINDQQNLELLGDGRRRARLLHKAGGRRSCLFHHVSDGAEGTEEARGTSGRGGLGLLRLLSRLGGMPLLRCRGAGGRLDQCRTFGWGLCRGRSCRGGCNLLGRRGGGRGWRSRWVRPLKVCHVAVGQVGHEAAVRESAPEEVHDFGRMVGLSISRSFFFFFFLVLKCLCWISRLDGVKAEAALDQRLDE